jgi:hypothetical protein
VQAPTTTTTPGPYALWAVIGELDEFADAATPAELLVAKLGFDRLDRLDRATLATAVSVFEKRVNDALTGHHVRFGHRTFWAEAGATADAPDAIRTAIAGIDLDQLIRAGLAASH